MIAIDGEIALEVCDIDRIADPGGVARTCDGLARRQPLAGGGNGRRDEDAGPLDTA